MSILELKQAVSRLSKRERAELQAYLIRLRHNTTEWRREAAKRVRAVKAGKFVIAGELEAPVAHG